jgi:hypothetical protein
MADFVFTNAAGASAEKIRDSAANVGIMLLKASEGDAGLKDRATLSAITGAAGNTEADFTNYARKTALTGTVTVDAANDRVDLSIPNQTWTAAGGATNNTLVKAIVFYQDAAADASRVPLVGLGLRGDDGRDGPDDPVQRRGLPAPDGRLTWLGSTSRRRTRPPAR